MIFHYLVLGLVVVGVIVVMALSAAQLYKSYAWKSRVKRLTEEWKLADAVKAKVAARTCACAHTDVRSTRIGIGPVGGNP